MKTIKGIAVCLSLLFVFAAASACGGEPQTIYQAATELSYYDGTYYDEIKQETYYNDELWRRAGGLVEGADPMVLDDTSRTGYYYAYITGMTVYYSDDLVDWTYGSSFMDLGELEGAGSQWAPEVIYDEDSGLYFAFFSLSPLRDASMEGVAGPTYMAVAATSASPLGPFKFIDFTDADSVTAALGEGAEEYVRTPSEDYPQYYAKYALFDSAAYQAAFEREGLSTEERIYTVTGRSIDAGYVATIDLSPYVDPDTGEKYMYWSQTPGAIAGVKMINWLTPDWSTYKTLTCCHYYTVEDYQKAMNGETVEQVLYEMAASYCNEGPFMYKHNGKYYLTFSIGAYTESSYGVMQAVGDSPLGPFRKLTDAENGMMLNNDFGTNYATSGPGHHSFFTAQVNGEEKLIIAYHAHRSPLDNSRVLRFDEVKWVTVEDIDGEPLDVMHVNGPTVTVQPSFGIGKEYGDISNSFADATLLRGELAEGSSPSSLIDGLFSCFTLVSQAFDEKYVPETRLAATSTFELTLDTPREVCGVMFYNSKIDETTFDAVKNIAFICEENGREKVYLIPELSFNKDDNYYYYAADDSYHLIYGGGCYAEFAPLTNVKAIRFTVEVPEGKESVGIAEVALVGKFATQA